MTDHLPYDHEEFHSDFDLWSNNPVKPRYMSHMPVRSYPRNPIKRWVFDLFGVRYAEPGITQGSVVYWDGNVLRVMKSLEMPAGVAVSDLRFVERGYFSVKMQPGAVLKDSAGYKIGVVNEKGQIEIGGQNGTD